VGVDIQDVAEVARSISTLQERYVGRFFDNHERDWARRAPSLAPQYLAGRFAAREAVAKLLAAEDVFVIWHEIDLVDEVPAVGVRLRGAAHVLAERRGVTRIHLSISSTRREAIAVAVGDVVLHTNAKDTALSTTIATIRQVLDAQGQLPVAMSTLSDDDDLYENGLTSHASVNVMLAIEDAFDIEFPDAMLKKSTFQTVAALSEALSTLGVKDTAQ
jgi:phosphopantetheine--protein transferase-like protein